MNTLHCVTFSRNIYEQMSKIVSLMGAGPSRTQKRVPEHEHVIGAIPRNTGYTLYRCHRPRFIGHRTGTLPGPCLQTFTITLAHLKEGHMTTHVDPPKPPKTRLFQYGHTLSRRPQASPRYIGRQIYHVPRNVPVQW